MPSLSIWRSCWTSIFWEIAGIARSSSENRSSFPPNRWKRITSFHRPSRIFSACSTPLAAVAGVYCRPLLVGEYLTFRCVLVIWRASFYLQVRSIGVGPIQPPSKGNEADVSRTTRSPRRLFRGRKQKRLRGSRRVLCRPCRCARRRPEDRRCPQHQAVDERRQGEVPAHRRADRSRRAGRKDDRDREGCRQLSQQPREAQPHLQD